MPRRPTTRTIERTAVTPDHIALHEMEGSEADNWHPVINLDNGRVDCDCPDYGMRKLPQARRDGVRPDIGRPKYQCKHIQAAVREAIQCGDIILTLKGHQ